MKYAYIDHKFNTTSMKLINLVNGIVTEYAEQGFDLTLRQLYYQLVARDYIENTQRSYKRIGSVVRNGRLAGLIDWSAIVDRTRTLRRRSHWDNPQDILKSVSAGYHIDMWKEQYHRPEVWIEKDALAGVISGVCNELDVPFFACRGYVSLSEMYSAGQRVLRHMGKEQLPVIYHLGDHDPSGIDMTRDMSDRLELLTGGVEGKSFLFKRIALEMDQIEQYDPPPNPTKLTDSRSEGYLNEYGYDSWELDALTPQVIVDLIRSNIATLIDDAQWDYDELCKEQSKSELASIHKRYGEIVSFLDK